MTRLFVILFAALALSAPAVAQDAGESCTAIASDTERLACYDAIFRPAEDGPVAPEVVIDSEQLIPARPVGRAPAVMTVACIDGGASVRFSFANQLLSNTSDNAPLTFQVDLAGNTVRNLPVGEDNTTVGFASARDAASFLDTLEGARSLRVRVTPVRQRSLTVDFRLQERNEEIGAVRAACQ